MTPTPPRCFSQTIATQGETTVTDPWARAQAEMHAELARCQGLPALPTLDALMSEARNLGIRLLVAVDAPAQSGHRQGAMR